MDLFYLAIILVFFGLSWAFVRLCGQIGGHL